MENENSAPLRVFLDPGPPILNAISGQRVYTLEKVGEIDINICPEQKKRILSEIEKGKQKIILIVNEGKDFEAIPIELIHLLN